MEEDGAGWEVQDAVPWWGPPVTEREGEARWGMRRAMYRLVSIDRQF